MKKLQLGMQFNTGGKENFCVTVVGFKMVTVATKKGGVKKKVWKIVMSKAKPHLPTISDFNRSIGMSDGSMHINAPIR